MKPGGPVPRPTYEVTDASPKVVAITAGVLAAGIIFALFVAAGFYTSRYKPQYRPDSPRRQSSFQDGPNYRTSIEIESAQLRVDTAAHLNNYAWIDRGKGLVRIPVQRAMELLTSEAAAADNPGNAGTRPPPPWPSPVPAGTSPPKENRP